MRIPSSTGNVGALSVPPRSSRNAAATYAVQRPGPLSLKARARLRFRTFNYDGYSPLPEVQAGDFLPSWLVNVAYDPSTGRYKMSAPAIIDRYVPSNGTWDRIKHTFANDELSAYAAESLAVIDPSRPCPANQARSANGACVMTPVGNGYDLPLSGTGNVGAPLPGQAFNKGKIPSIYRRPCPPGTRYDANGSCVPIDWHPAGGGAPCTTKDGYAGVIGRDGNCYATSALSGVGAVSGHGRSYRVVRGDNIFVIAKKHGQPASRARDLLAANPRFAKVRRAHGLDFASLKIGDVIVIPWYPVGGGAPCTTKDGYAGSIGTDGNCYAANINGVNGTVGAADSYTPSIPGVCVPPYYYDSASGECVVGCPYGQSMTSSGCQPDAPNCVPGAPCQSGGLPGQYNNACNCEVLPGAGSGTPVDCQALTGRSDCYPDPSGPGGCMCPEAQLDCAALTGRTDFTACGGGCTFCGPNATVNPTDCLCDCLPGYMPDPSGLEGAGCVLIPADVPVNGNGQPIDNSGQPIDTGSPVPVTNTPASTSSEESSNAGAILLGLAAVVGIGYGAYAISKKRLQISRYKE